MSRAENFGTIRLYSFSSFQGSQTDMLISTFDNEITEDDTYVADIDELCLIPENFPNCANGVYKEPTNNSWIIDPDGRECGNCHGEIPTPAPEDECNDSIMIEYDLCNY